MTVVATDVAAVPPMLLPCQLVLLLCVLMKCKVRAANFALFKVNIYIVRNMHVAAAKAKGKPLDIAGICIWICV